MRLLRELEERYLKNTNLFRRCFPTISKRFQEEDPEINIELSILSENQYNLIVNGQFVYPTHPKFFSYQQVENFLKNPRKIKIAFPQEEFNINTIFHSHLEKLQRLIQEYDIENDYKFDGKYIHTLMIEGILFGHHIEKIVEKIDIDLLILLDFSTDLIKPSLYTIDWEKILNKFSDKGKEIIILYDKDPEILAKKVLEYFWKNNKILRMTFFYNFSMFYSNFWENFEKYFKYHAHPLLRGWGFYDDEIISIIHTFKNVERKIPILKPKRINKGSVCLVGSGPSLDEGIEWLKKYQNDITIFSCGSAIKALEKEDIYPDIHIEIERTHSTYLSLKEISREYLNKIPIIAPNCMDPDVFKLSKNSIMFLKFNDVGGYILEKHLKCKPLLFCNPTVVNTGLAIAIEFGFKEIYLLGVDLGFLNEKNHHAQNTVYYQNPEKFKFNKKIREFKREDGKIVYTIDDFLYTKKVIEALIENKRKEKIRIYHINPILTIKGTIPIPLSTKIDSQKAKIEIDRSAWKKYKINTKQIIKDLTTETKENLLRIKNIIDRKITNHKEILQTFDTYSKYIQQWSLNKPISATLFKGSLLHFGRYCISYSFLCRKTDLPDFYDNFKKEIFSFLNEAQKNLEKLKDYNIKNELEKIEPNIRDRLGRKAFYRLI